MTTVVSQVLPTLSVPFHCGLVKFQLLSSTSLCLRDLSGTAEAVYLCIHGSPERTGSYHPLKAPCGPVKLTHEINNHKQELLEVLFYLTQVVYQIIIANYTPYSPEKSFA